MLVKILENKHARNGHGTVYLYLPLPLRRQSRGYVFSNTPHIHTLA